MRKDLYFQSHKFTSGNINEPVFDLDYFSIKNVTEIKIKSISLKLSFYHILNKTLIWQSTGSGGEQTENITDGNYTGTQLAAHLQALMILSDASVLVTYNSINYKITFSATTDIRIDLTGTLNKNIGFSTTVDSPLIAAATVTGDDIVYLVPTALYIKSGSLIGMNTSIYEQLASDVIVQIPVNQSMGSLLSYDDLFLFETESNNKRTIRRVDFGIYGDDDNLLDFNGASFAIRASVNYEYDI
jgi:hypothetical protein